MLTRACDQNEVKQVQHDTVKVKRRSLEFKECLFYYNSFYFKSNRSAFITLFQAAMKSFTNFSLASALRKLLQRLLIQNSTQKPNRHGYLSISAYLFYGRYPNKLHDSRP